MKLRLVTPPTGSWYDAKAGDCWPCKWETHKIVGREACIVIRLPGAGYCWHTNHPSEDGKLWNVKGGLPNLTITPSINVGPEIWHGWITNGEINPEVDSSGNT